MDGFTPRVPDLPPAAPPASRLRRLAGAAAGAWQLGHRALFALVPVALAAAMLAVVLHQALRQPIEVHPLAVPAPLLATGLTPEVAALRLMDAIESTARAVHAETMHRPSAELEGSAPDVTIPGAGLSLRSLSTVLRHLMGWPERRITGEFLLADKRLRLRLRLARHGVVADVEGPAADGPDPLLARAAPELWRALSPRLYAWHLAQSGGDPQELRDRLLQLRRRVADDETDATLAYLIARSLVQSGRAPEALEMLDALIAARPRYPAGHYGRAQALRALGEREAALAAQARGMALDPGSPWAHLTSAELLRELGRLEDALAAARRAQALDEDDRPGLVEESRVLRLLVRLPEAAEAARRALAIDRAHAPAVAALGHVMAARGEATEALAVFDRAVALLPTLAEAHAGRGAALAALGRPAEALEALARAIALDEADHHPHAVRAELHRALGEWEAALAAFDAALARAPDRPALHLGRGVVLIETGDRAAALHALQRARALGMEDEALRRLLAELGG
jgi:tetratricopeptide (TPR) repeat protein